MEPTDSIAAKFIALYYEIYQSHLREYRDVTGKKIEEYKTYEPEYLDYFLLNYKDENTIVEQATSVVSQLILMQALPNANHRSAFMFLQIYLLKHKVPMEIYDDAKEHYDRFYKHSKAILSTDINHQGLINPSYHDVLHSQGIENHRRHAGELLNVIVHVPQSGIVTVESLHRFIASMNQGGSFPSSNHLG